VHQRWDDDIELEGEALLKGIQDLSLAFWYHFWVKARLVVSYFGEAHHSSSLN